MMRRTAPILAFALLLLESRAQGVDFIRGDANSDGQVTFADSHFMLNFIFRGGMAPECLKASDVNADTKIDLSDAIGLIQYFVQGGPSPAAPYPEPGPDPTPDEWLVCETYGSGSPLEDPAAKMEILDTEAPGGAEGGATIRIAVSNTAPIAGYFGKITVAPGLLSGIVCYPVDLSGTYHAGFHGSSGEPSTGPTSVLFGFLSSLIHDAPIPAGEGVAVLDILVCLEPGTPAGDYPLTLEAAELVDNASGRTVPAARADGVLHVLAAVEDSASSCSISPDCPDEPVEPPDPPDPPDPPAPGPDYIDCTFELGSVKTQPGGTAMVPFYIRATTDLEGLAPIEVMGYSFSADFDEEVLEATQIVPLFQKPDGTKYDFMIYKFNNDNVTPGNAGVDEGYLLGAVVFEFHVDANHLPGDTDSPALAFEFRVRPEAQVSSTEIRFLDGAAIPGSPPVINMLTVFGQSFTPEAFNSFVFINGYVEVLPDIIAFIRGDSNGDEELGLADSVMTLGYLFLGSGAPACYDAADADDNGNIDVSDPVYTLMYLFLGGSPPPAPFPQAGEDPTDDPMDCLTRSR